MSTIHTTHTIHIHIANRNANTTMTMKTTYRHIHNIDNDIQHINNKHHHGQEDTMSTRITYQQKHNTTPNTNYDKQYNI